MGGRGYTPHIHTHFIGNKHFLLKLKLLKISLDISLIRELRARIIGCQSQVKLCKFFYGMRLS